MDSNEPPDEAIPSEDIRVKDLPPKYVLPLVQLMYDSSTSTLGQAIETFGLLTFGEWKKRVQRFALAPHYVYRRYFAYGDNAKPGIDTPKSIVPPSADPHSLPEQSRDSETTTVPQVLMTAVQSGTVDTVKALLFAGVDPNAYCLDGIRMLNLAVNFGHGAIAELLLNHHADLTARDIYNKTTPLMQAIKAGRNDMIQLLIERGADLSEDMVMHWIVARADLPTIQLALECGPRNAKRVRVGPFDETLIHSAVRYGEPEILDLLLSNPGSDLDIPNKAGNTAFHCALMTDNQILASLLVNAGADIDAKGPTGHTPLHLALMRRHLNVAQMLIERGCRLNVLSPLAESELHVAVNAKALSIIRMLLARNADMNAHSDDPKIGSPLHYAVRTRDAQFVQTVLQEGLGQSDLTIRDEFDRTPLEDAENMGLTEIADMICEYL